MSPATDLGEWRPLSRAELRAVLEPLGVRWWLAGGHALELFARGSWRSHGDIDAGIQRAELPRVSRALVGWELFAAEGGTLTPLRRGEPAPPGANSVWCRMRVGGPWRFEFLLDDCDGSSDWLFRRDHGIRVPLAELTMRSADGFPYLRPEIQLLYKAKALRVQDEADFAAVAPLLGRSASDWLRAALERVHPGHPWLALPPLRAT